VNKAFHFAFLAVRSSPGVKVGGNAVPRPGIYALQRSHAGPADCFFQWERTFLGPQFQPK